MDRWLSLRTVIISVRTLSVAVLFVVSSMGCSAQDLLLLNIGGGPAVGHVLQDKDNPHWDEGELTAKAAWSIGAAFVGWDSLGHLGIAFGLEHIIQGYSAYHEDGTGATHTTYDEEGRTGLLNVSAGVLFHPFRDWDMEMGGWFGRPVWVNSTVHQVRTSMGTTEESTYTRNTPGEGSADFGLYAGLGKEWRLGGKYKLLTGVRVNQLYGSVGQKASITQGLLRVAVIREL